MRTLSSRKGSSFTNFTIEHLYGGEVEICGNLKDGRTLVTLTDCAGEQKFVSARMRLRGKVLYELGNLVAC